jgi:hypothetical protein
MTSDVKELLLISLKAQGKYVSQRIYDENKRRRFDMTMHDLTNCVGFFKDARPHQVELLYQYSRKYPGVSMAIDIYTETYHNLTARFIDGTSSRDSVLEKL